MTTHIALLRAINVGGHKKVAIADLRGLVAELGFDDVQSLLQTGNLVFRGGARRGAGIERMLEAQAEERLELSTTFFVRSAKDWEAIIAHNPFVDAARNDPGHLVVMFLKDAPSASATKALQAAIKGPEIVRSWKKHVYVAYPEGIGRSRLTNSIIEGKLGTRATGRNWNTVLKLAELARA